MVLLSRGLDLSQPLTWRPYTAQTGGLKANIVGACNHGMNIRNHTIASDGTVSPSVVCPHPGCGWHVFVRLVGWAADGERQ